MNDAGTMVVATWWRRAWPWVLGALPALALLVFILELRTGVPYWDEWHFIGLLERAADGTLSWGDLWLPHNEHRPILTKLIFIALARATDWSDTAELLVNYGIAVSTLALLLGLTARALPGKRWALPFISLLVCSLAQWENWLWGIQSMFFLAVLAAVAGFAAIARWRGRWGVLAVGAACGVAMTFSFALGVAFWPIGALVLALAHPWSERRTRWGLAVWCAFAVAVLLVFFHGYSRVDSPAWLHAAAANPVGYLRYVLNFLGAALLRDDRAVLAGSLGVVVWIAAAGALFRRRTIGSPELLPFVALSALSVAAALIAGLGRQQFGPGQAIASRYVTLSYPFWVSMVVFLAALCPKGARPRSWLAAAAPSALAAVVVLSAVNAIAGGVDGYRQRYLATRAVKAALQAGRPVSDEQLHVLHPDAAFVRQGLAYLRAHHLSLFRR